MTDSDVPDILGKPNLDPEAWIAAGALVIGDVRIARGANIWYGCVLRSDMQGAWIEIGEDTNIQDGTIVHVDTNLPCRIGARVTVGHRAVIHAATIGDGALIGMGAVVLSGATVGRDTVVAAGAVVAENVNIPPGVIAAGVPAKVRRELIPEDLARLEHGWRVYGRLRDLHRSKGPV